MSAGNEGVPEVGAVYARVRQRVRAILDSDPAMQPLYRVLRAASSADLESAADPAELMHLLRSRDMAAATLVVSLTVAALAVQGLAVQVDESPDDVLVALWGRVLPA